MYDPFIIFLLQNTAMNEIIKYVVHTYIFLDNISYIILTVQLERENKREAHANWKLFKFDIIGFLFNFHFYYLLRSFYTSPDSFAFITGRG